MILPDVNTLLYAVNRSSDQHTVALKELQRSFGNPRGVAFAPDARSLTLCSGPRGVAGNLTTDAHLAALAIEHGATVLSFDRDFARFEGVRWTLPTSD